METGSGQLYSSRRALDSWLLTCRSTTPLLLFFFKKREISKSKRRVCDRPSKRTVDAWCVVRDLVGHRCLTITHRSTTCSSLPHALRTPNPLLECWCFVSVCLICTLAMPMFGSIGATDWTDCTVPVRLIFYLIWYYSTRKKEKDMSNCQYILCPALVVSGTSKQFSNLPNYTNFRGVWLQPHLMSDKFDQNCKCLVSN